MFLYLEIDMMNINEAKSIISDSESSFTDKYRAVIAIVESEDVQCDDLLPCLDVEGMGAELAAMKLHTMTGRVRDNKPLGVYLDRQDWEEFLKRS